MHADLEPGLVPGVDLPAALLWDFDGTLVDSEKSWHAAERRLAGEWGATLTAAQQKEMTGLSLRDSALNLMRIAGRTDLDPDAYARVLNDYALEDRRGQGVDFRPGARELLDAAAAAGIRQALVSATFVSVLEAILAGMDTHPYEVVVGGDMVSHGKPGPEPYLLAVERLGLEVRDCLALEDSIPGTTSAERAGVATLAVPFEQEIAPGVRRRLVPTLSGLGLAEVGRHWRELRDA